MRGYWIIGMLVLSGWMLGGCKKPETTHPERKDIVDAVFAYGEIEYDEQYIVSAYIDGYIDQVYIDEGDSVSEGKLLFRIRNDISELQVAQAISDYKYALEKAMAGSPAIQQTRLQILKQRQQVRQDSANYARYAALVQTNAVSKVDFEQAKLAYEQSLAQLHVLQEDLDELTDELEHQLKSARNNLKIEAESDDYYTLSAEHSGGVLQVHKVAGELVMRGEALAEIGAGQPLVRLYIAEGDMPLIALGQKVLVSLNTEPEVAYAASIINIYPAFNADEQSFLAEAAFVETPQSLRAGTQLQANIIIDEIKHALVIPRNYLIDGDSVMLAGSEEKVPVQTGIVNLEWVQITGGLSETDEIMLYED